MSMKVMADVLDYPFPHTQKAVMLALANQCNDFGQHCFPGFDLIARHTSLGRRTIFDALGQLEEDGFISRLRMRNSQRIEFRIHVERLKQPNLPGLEPEDPAGRSVKRTGAGAAPVHQPHQCESRTGAGDSETGAGDAPTGAGAALHKAPAIYPKAPLIDDVLAQATAAGALAVGILRELGVTCGITAQHPKLLEAAAAGVTAQAVIDLAKANPGKPAIYALTVALNQRLEVASGAAPATGQRARAGPARTRANDDFSNAKYVGTPEDELPAELR